MTIETLEEAIKSQEQIENFARKAYAATIAVDRLEAALRIDAA